MQRAIKFLVLALCVNLFACTTTATVDGFDPVDEPELSNAEVAELPDATLDHEHDQDMLVEGTPEDDAAMFDDDIASNFYDEDGIDNDEVPQPLTGTIAFQPLLKYGLHPRASDALRAAGVSAWRIVQTIGNAPASAGVHLQDGTFNGHPYTAAVDISVSGLSSTQIHNLLEKLGKVGYAGWYRKYGSDGWYGVNHIHAVYANCKMKSALRSQIRSWLVNRNGLVSNTIYHWHTFSAAAKTVVRAKFAASSYGTTNGGSGVAARVNTSGIALNVRAGASTNTSIVGSLADGTYITIKCQKYGQSLTGTYGTSTLWDKVGSGYVADVYVATGSDGRVAPLCP